jgi:hypothetical protein
MITPQRKSNFHIYTDSNTQNTEKSIDLPKNPPTKKQRISIEAPSLLENWLRPPLTELNRNFRRPGDTPWTLARLPKKVMSLGSLKKWQKKQPNDHTSKILFIFYLFYSYINLF